VHVCMLLCSTCTAYHIHGPALGQL
jgi:hypothetical protein